MLYVRKDQRAKNSHCVPLMCFCPSFLFTSTTKSWMTAFFDGKKSSKQMICCCRWATGAGNNHNLKSVYHRSPRNCYCSRICNSFINDTLNKRITNVIIKTIQNHNNSMVSLRCINYFRALRHSFYQYHVGLYNNAGSGRPIIASYDTNVI